MILNIRKTNQTLMPEVPMKGYYVEITWYRLEGAREMKKYDTIGPFPEYAKDQLLEFINLVDRLQLRDGGARLYPEIKGFGKWFCQKPGDAPLGLTITTPNDGLGGKCPYEIENWWAYWQDGISAAKHCIEAVDVAPDREPAPATSPFLLNLPQYHFERSVFVTAFTDILGQDLCDEVQDLCIETKLTDSFLLTNDGDERYIIHLPSGTVINWYKHLGRTNTCSKPGFGLDDLREFLLSLKDELEE